MAKIKICLDSACINYRMVEDGKLVQQRKEKCDKNWKPPEGFDEKLDDLMKRTREVNIASPGTFDMTAKVGEDLQLVGSDHRASPKQTKEQEIVQLQKRLKELSGT